MIVTYGMVTMVVLANGLSFYVVLFSVVSCIILTSIHRSVIFKTKY